MQNLGTPHETAKLGVKTYTPSGDIIPNWELRASIYQSKNADYVMGGLWTVTSRRVYKPPNNKITPLLLSELHFH